MICGCLNDEASTRATLPGISSNSNHLERRYSGSHSIPTLWSVVVATHGLPRRALVYHGCKPGPTSVATPQPVGVLRGSKSANTKLPTNRTPCEEHVLGEDDHGLGENGNTAKHHQLAISMSITNTSQVDHAAKSRVAHDDTQDRSQSGDGK